MEFDKRLPIYEQLIHYFKQAIVSGEYPAGEPLPSRREVAAKFKVNPNTVQRAFKEMEEMQLIVTKSNVQSTVTDDETVLQNLRNDFILEALRQMYRTLEPLNLTNEQLLNYLNQIIREEDGGKDVNS